jgi:hypothetical protein
MKDINIYAMKKYSEIVAKNYSMKDYRKDIIKNLLVKLKTNNMCRISMILKQIF